MGSFYFINFILNDAAKNCLLQKPLYEFPIRKEIINTFNSTCWNMSEKDSVWFVLFIVYLMPILVCFFFHEVLKWEIQNSKECMINRFLRVCCASYKERTID